MAKTPNTSNWGSAKARERYGSSGMVKKADGGGITTVMTRAKDDPSAKKDFTEQPKLGGRGMVPPYAQQELKSGKRGPLNITPKPIKGIEE